MPAFVASLPALHRPPLPPHPHAVTHPKCWPAVQVELAALGAGRVHLRKLRAAIDRHRRSSTAAGSAAQPQPAAAASDASSGAGASPQPQYTSPGGKRFAAFLSHHKVAAAMDARFVKDKLEQMLGGGAEVFLDSDNLQDLRLLLDHVRQSDVLVLFQACPQAGSAPRGARACPR